MSEDLQCTNLGYPGGEDSCPAASESCVGVGVWDRVAEWAASGGNATFLLSLGTELVQLLQNSSLASKLVACFARKVAKVLWCAVDEHVPRDGNGVMLLRWGHTWRLQSEIMLYIIWVTQKQCRKL